jgi:hypothetical protein
MSIAGVCSALGTVTSTPALTRISTVTYLEPSPDWFIGLRAFPLCQNNSWVSFARIPLFPYDMGTHEGESLEWSTQRTEPQGPVMRFLDNPLSIFFDTALCGPVLLMCTGHGSHGQNLLPEFSVSTSRKRFLLVIYMHTFSKFSRVSRVKRCSCRQAYAAFWPATINQVPPTPLNHPSA